jgi:hypothetical protein
MSFADDFAAALATREIVVDAASLPDRDTIQQQLSDIQNWFSELDSAVREGYDEGTAEFKLCHIIAEPDINVAPDLAGLMDAFDETIGQRLSQMLQASQDAFDEADAA